MILQAVYSTKDSSGTAAYDINLTHDLYHMLTDFASVWISLISLRISGWAIDNDKTFGYRRAEILGALGSVMVVWANEFW